MVRPFLRSAVRTLNPSYFALVMATGIVSIAVRLQRASTLSTALLWVTAAGYAVLVALTAWRLVAFRDEMWHDLNDPERGFGYFTFVAGTDVLGTRLAVGGQHRAAAILLLVGALSWLALGYAVPWATALRHAGRATAAVASGIWFVWVVGAQSVAVLAATLDRSIPGLAAALALVAAAAWSVGAALYVGLAVLMMIRLTQRRMRPEELSPPYWVAMGATAITVVAATLILRMTAGPPVAAIRELVAGVAVMFWSFGTWLIPPLLAAGWWRHVRRRVPVGYTAAWWSVVFPLGMYATASHDLGATHLLPYATGIGQAMTWVAFAAWLVTFAAMLLHLRGRRA